MGTASARSGRRAAQLLHRARHLLSPAPRPTSRGLGTLGLLVGLVVVVLVTDTDQLVPLTVAMGVPLLMAPPWAAIRARRARARLAVAATVSPRMGAVGDRVSLRIRVTNRTAEAVPTLSIAPLPGHWTRQVAGRPSPVKGIRTGAAAASPGFGGLLRRLLLPSRCVPLPVPGPLSSESYSSPVPCNRRGVFTLAAQPMWVLDPFGLFGASSAVLPAVTVVFYPARGDAPDWVLDPELEHRHNATTTAESGQRDGVGELIGIRPYVTGDRLSLVHWAAVARYRSWFVRQFAAEHGAQLGLTLDDRAGVHRQTEFELLLQQAHGFVERCLEQGATVGLRTLSGHAMTMTPVPQGLEEARLFLATVLPTSLVTLPPVDGAVLTTVTGDRSLPAGLDRIVVRT